MSERDGLARSFLDGTEWANARRSPLAGDASNRRYERLTQPTTGKTAVLMDAPPDKGEDVRPFLYIARHLCAIGLSAPEILAEDCHNGFLLIEDLGDALFARVIPVQPQLEPTLYAAATDVLLTLHGAGLPQLDSYDTGLMTEMAALAFAKYRFGIMTVPENVRTCPDGLLRQMGAYAAMLDRIYPGQHIETEILWTRTATLMVLPHDLVTNALFRAPRLDGTDMGS